MGWNRRVVSLKPTVPQPQQMRVRGKEESYRGALATSVPALREKAFPSLINNNISCQFFIYVFYEDEKFHSLSPPPREFF